MKRKIAISLLIITSFLVVGLTTNISVEEEDFSQPVNIRVKQSALPDFGIEIDDTYTNDTIVLSEDPTFYFAFDFNISYTAYFGGADEGVYGGGYQPENWNESGEVDFATYGDYETHYTETRIVGIYNILIDDTNLGLSNYDPYSGSGDTYQTFPIDLEPGVHYLTAIAAEYILPYIGATVDLVEIQWVKDVHVFYVLENPGDPLPTSASTAILLDTVGTPYAETFTYVDDVPLEYPKVRPTYVNDDDVYNPILGYDYNVSTDGTLELTYDEYWGVPVVTKAGDGGVAWWINDAEIAATPQALQTGNMNYVYICAVSIGPWDYYADEFYYPTLKMDVGIVRIELVGANVEYVSEETTIIETNTYTTTITEEGNTVIVTTTVTEGNAEAPLAFVYVLLPILLLAGNRMIKPKHRRTKQ